MDSQTSRAALLGLEQAEWLATSTDTHEPLASDKLEELYLSNLPDGEEPNLPDFQQVQGSNVVLLQESARSMWQVDQTHRGNRVALKKMRSRRQELVRAIRKRYRDERKSFEGTYGEESLADVGLDAPPGGSFLKVRLQLLEFRERLRDPKTPAKLGEPLAGHAPINPIVLADAIDDEFNAYDTLMDDIRAQRKQTEESKILKDAALDDHRRVVVNVARVQEGYYRLVGLDEFADRMRAVRRRRTAKEEEKPENGEPADSPAEEQTP